MADLLRNSDIPRTLRGRLERLWAEDVDTAIHYISAPARKMEALVEGLLQLARIGRQALAPVLLDMNAVVAEVLAAMQVEFQAAAARVDVERLPPLLADRAGVSQAFANLVGNAVRYRHPDRALRVRIWAETASGMRRYCVEDNGIGIDPAFAEQIFRPFFKLDPAGSDAHGLGLAIVQRIAERHGGRAWAESAPGDGSRFWLEFPAHADGRGRDQWCRESGP